MQQQQMLQNVNFQNNNIPIPPIGPTYNSSQNSNTNLNSFNNNYYNQNISNSPHSPPITSPPGIPFPNNQGGSVNNQVGGNNGMGLNLNFMNQVYSNNNTPLNSFTQSNPYNPQQQQQQFQNIFN